MNWKDVLIGAISTLAVTVLGGVVIYYVTKEPELKSRELLAYSVRSSGDFSGDKERVAFTSIVIANRGGRVANNVVANIKFSGPLIKDLTTDTVPGTREDRNVAKDLARLTYHKLLPGEAVTVNLLLDSPARPTVTVRSDESLAVSESTLGAEKTEKLTDINRASSLVVPISALIFSILSIKILKGAKKLGIANGMLSNKNNAAFLLLHSGLSKEAEEILTESVRSGQYDSYTLSNLAVCKAINGDIEKAGALMSAAKYRDTNDHAAAVVLFNDALLNLISEKRSEAIADLKKAITLSPKEIKRYCERSVHLKDYRGTPDFIALLDVA